MPQVKAKGTKGGRSKRKPSTGRYNSERHRELHKLKHVLMSSGSAAMLQWASENNCLDLARRLE